MRRLGANAVLYRWYDSEPPVLDAVGDVLPERGVLGIVKNLVEREPDLTHDQRMRFERLYG